MAHEGLVRVSAAHFKRAAQNKEDTSKLLPVKYGPSEVLKDEGGAAERVLTWVVSTAAVDRDNDTIDPHGWELLNFNRGGSVLWAHDRKMPPIARPLATWVEDGKLKSRAQFTAQDENPFGYMIWRLAESGTVRSASVGFLPKHWRYNEGRGECAVDFLKQELLEWSAVPVPSNPEALAEARSKGVDLAPLVEWTEMSLDGELPLVVPRETLEEVRKHAKGGVVVSVVSKDASGGDAGDAGGGDDSSPDASTQSDTPAASSSAGSETQSEEQTSGHEADPADFAEALQRINERLALLESMASPAPEPEPVGDSGDSASEGADDDDCLVELDDLTSDEIAFELDVDELRANLRGLMRKSVTEKVDGAIRRLRGRVD